MDTSAVQRKKSRHGAGLGTSDISLDTAVLLGFDAMIKTSLG